MVPRNHVLDGGRDHSWEGAILRRKGRPVVKYVATLCRELCKNGRTDRDAVWDLNSSGPKEACIRWGHTNATWRISLNRPCAAAMRAVRRDFKWPRHRAVTSSALSNMVFEGLPDVQRLD